MINTGSEKEKGESPFLWIQGLLPIEVLEQDPTYWRPPTAAEIRLVVGRDSHTGMSGASAAKLIGVNTASFRKYTAREDAINQQKMSYAAWHLLLHKAGIRHVKFGAAMSST